MGSSRRGRGHPSILSPHHFEGPVPPARGCPHEFVAVPAGVTCSPRGVLSPLEMEDGEERQEPPQEVPGQRCGEPEGEGGRVRAGPSPALRRPAPPAPYPRRPAPGRPCCGSRRPRSARTGYAAARPPSPPRPRTARTAPPSWEAASAGGHVGEVVPNSGADRAAVVAPPSRLRGRGTKEKGRGKAGAQLSPPWSGHTHGRCRLPCLEGQRPGPKPGFAEGALPLPAWARRFRRVTLASPSVRRERDGAARRPLCGGERGEPRGPLRSPGRRGGQ